MAFYTYSEACSPAKPSTISQVNAGSSSLLNLVSRINLNYPSYLSHPGPYSKVLSDHFFDGDLPKTKSSESNIVDTSEYLFVESLTRLREEVLNKEFDHGVDYFLDRSQSLLYQTLHIHR